MTPARSVPAWGEPWAQAAWLNPPASSGWDNGDLVVTAKEAATSGARPRTVLSTTPVTRCWHRSLSGPPSRPTLVLDAVEQFDQAGLLVRVDEGNWVKAGVEVSDGVPPVGAVVTRETSDWSVAPVPQWRGREVTVRASRDEEALTVRARCGSEPWQLVRVAPLPARTEIYRQAPTAARRPGRA